MRWRRDILRRGGRTLATWVTGFVLLARPLDGVTLEELRSDPDLNPKRLMSRLSRFKYELHAEVQAPEAFLAAESGDCDDFATLAAMVLREKGFTPRLFAVRMPGLTHVVCYVSEAGSYMDYNNRMYMKSLVKTKPEIREIADKVAKSFDSSWTTASEFIYTNQVKIMVSTVARAETFVAAPPASASGPTNKVSVRQLNIGF